MDMHALLLLGAGSSRTAAPFGGVVGVTGGAVNGDALAKLEGSMVASGKYDGRCLVTVGLSCGLSAQDAAEG
jgi:hypothetical protein